jgi:hypothetical protein
MDRDRGGPDAGAVNSERGVTPHLLRFTSPKPTTNLSVACSAPPALRELISTLRTQQFVKV